MKTDSNQIKGLRYCNRCCFPKPLRALSLMKWACRSCISSEQKIHIDWKEKEKLFAIFSIKQRKIQVIIMIA